MATIDHKNITTDNSISRFAFIYLPFPFMSCFKVNDVFGPFTFSVNSTSDTTGELVTGFSEGFGEGAKEGKFEGAMQHI